MTTYHAIIFQGLQKQAADAWKELNDKLQLLGRLMGHNLVLIAQGDSFRIESNLKPIFGQNFHTVNGLLDRIDFALVAFDNKDKSP